MNRLNKVIELVKPQYDRLDCWVHSWPHIERVTKNIIRITELEGVSFDSPLISGYCHDLGRIEEEARKERGESPLPHALLSIEPTIGVLQAVKISGVDFDEIVEAVTVHSYKTYEGNNLTAKILQDGDKLNGFGPYGVLGAIKYFGGIDYVDPKEIVANKEDRNATEELCNKSLTLCKGETLKKVIKGLGFVLEWYDMLHTKSAKNIIREEYEYTKQIRKDLIKTADI
jgi:HD superfamily phosphodiesterase